MEELSFSGHEGKKKVAKGILHHLITSNVNVRFQALLTKRLQAKDFHLNVKGGCIKLILFQ